MAAYQIACTALKVIVYAITLLNELTHFTTPWVFTGSTTVTPPIPFPSPFLTCSVYACLEPLYAALLAYLGLMPWIHHLAQVQHLWICQGVSEFLRYLGRTQHQKDVAVAEREKLKHGNGSNVELEAGSNQPHRLWRPKWQASIATFILLNSVAASNAALILFAADLEPSLRKDETNITLGFSYFAILCYFGSRFGDFTISQLTGKGFPWQHKSPSDTRCQFECLAILLMGKICLRGMLRQDKFPLANIFGSKPIRPTLAAELPPWLAASFEWRSSWPTWAKMTLSWVVVPALQIFGSYHLRKARNEDVPGEEHVSEDPTTLNGQ